MTLSCVDFRPRVPVWWENNYLEGDKFLQLQLGGQERATERADGGVCLFILSGGRRRGITENVTVSDWGQRSGRLGLPRASVMYQQNNFAKITSGSYYNGSQQCSSIHIYIFIRGVAISSGLIELSQEELVSTSPSTNHRHYCFLIKSTRRVTNCINRIENK